MIIQSTPVSFGAAGTPILVGVNDGVSSGQAVHDYASQIGWSQWTDFLGMIGAKVALLHAVAGVLIPLIVVCFLTRFFGTQIYEAFREIKGLFDPAGLMNPGLIIEPNAMDQDLRYGTEYKTPTGPTEYHYRENGSFAAAVEMCTGVGACRQKLADGTGIRALHWVESIRGTGVSD